MEQDDRTKCQSAVDKYVEFAKKYGSRVQIKHALEVLLPSSPVYDYLEGRVPQPAITYKKLAEIVEVEEKERINKEIGQRRTRLGARIDQVTLDVKREILGASELESIYQCIINWSNEDEVRRDFEEKLFQHAYDTLGTLPPDAKGPKLQQVKKLAEGIVILKHPFLLAWSVFLEWNDIEELSQLDKNVLRDFAENFPTIGLGQVLQGYLGSEISLFKATSLPSEDPEQEDQDTPMSADDRLLLMTEGFGDCGNSILSHRIMSEYFLYLQEYESSASVARKGQATISAQSKTSGLLFSNSLDAINLTLGTALVQYQAPRHHPEAKYLFEEILKHNPINTNALMGIGLISEEQEDYAGAVDFLNRALERSSDPKIKIEAAWCKALNGDGEIALAELEACLPEIEGIDTISRSLRSQALYRIGMCEWNLDSSKVARKDRKGAYARFIAALQVDPNFAPAYTILGTYYVDYAKDRKRARKCFQKAFELSPAEVEAAERLARSFADSKEWDLVEVVAQRVIDSGKVRPAPGSKKKGVSWPFAALGIVQLNNQDHSKSIVSFQTALRISPEDYYSWLGLGESYHNAGRYIAALRAFEQAQKIEEQNQNVSSNDHWFSTYMLANVKRELGIYTEAISNFEEVLRKKPTEIGVATNLLQTLVESSWRNIELGYYGRAAENAKRAIGIAKDLVEHSSGSFNLWKALGDACSIFCSIETEVASFPITEVAGLLKKHVADEACALLEDMDGVGRRSLEIFVKPSDESSPKPIIYASMLAFKQAIYVSSHDRNAQAVAWYNLGWIEYKSNQWTSKDFPTHSEGKIPRHLNASVQCFKRAIELESGNAEFWNSLGVVTTDLSPGVSQHAFVRSLHLNDKNARTWTNLGIFYLIHDDIHLAGEAFTRAQSADPEYSHAWLGQGLIASLTGEPKEAQKIFVHAFDIADSSNPTINRHYAMSMFDAALSSVAPVSNATNNLLPLFSLHQIQYQAMNDLPFQHLSALFAERTGDFTEAIENLTSLCEKLEAEYEQSESPATLAKFAQAEADLARAQLAEQDFASASSSAETSLDLSEDQEEKSAARTKARLSAHLTAGLASYHQGEVDKAISMFQSALSEMPQDPDIICMLAQVLWAKGGEEAQNLAREQLLDCIEKHPGHFDATTLLGTIAVLDQDSDTLEAVHADLQDLRVSEALGQQERLRIDQLLSAMALTNPAGGDDEVATLSEARTAVMIAPSQPHGWTQLADLVEEAYPAEMAVLMARKAVPPLGVLDAEGLGKSYAGTGRLDDAQRAIMLAPWALEGWQVLV